MDLHIHHLISLLFKIRRFTLSSVSLNSLTQLDLIKRQKRIFFKAMEKHQIIQAELLRIMILSAISCSIILKNKLQPQRDCSPNFLAYLTRGEPSQAPLYLPQDYGDIVGKKSQCFILLYLSYCFSFVPKGVWWSWNVIKQIWPQHNAQSLREFNKQMNHWQHHNFILNSKVS